MVKADRITNKKQHYLNIDFITDFEMARYNDINLSKVIYSMFGELKKESICQIILHCTT